MNWARIRAAAGRVAWPVLVAVVALVVAAVLGLNQGWLASRLTAPVLAALEFLAFLFFAVLFIYSLAPSPSFDLKAVAGWVRLPVLVVVVALVVAVIFGLNQGWLSSQLGVPVLAALEFLAFLFFAVAFIFALGPSPSVSANGGLDDSDSRRLGMRRRVFALNALILIGLFAIAVVHYKFPVEGDVLWLKTALHGIWFAMLGAVAISFKGVYDHTHPAEWNEGWWLWYLGRPLTGAIVGAMTYLLLQVATPGTTPSIPSLAVAAFVLGTQESRFFGFLYEVGKLVLTTPDSAQAVLKIVNVSPDQGSQGTVVLVTGTGFQAGATASFNGSPLTSMQVAPDGTALSGAAPARPGGVAVGDKVDLLVANTSGAAYLLPKAFTFTA